MRTDTQRLEVILNALHGSGDDAFLEAWQAAHTLGMEDRIALDAAIDARRIEVGESLPPITALDMLVAEMGRIRNVKGYSEAEDDEQLEDELPSAAACYLDPDLVCEHWPFGLSHFHPSPDDRKREVVKGCALALCELERLLRIDADVAERQGALELAAPAPREFKVGDRVRVTGVTGSQRAKVGMTGTVKEDNDPAPFIHFDPHLGCEFDHRRLGIPAGHADCVLASNLELTDE